MYLAIAYGLGAFTTLMVLTLLWLGWENRSERARAEREKRSTPANFRSDAPLTYRRRTGAGGPKRDGAIFDTLRALPSAAMIDVGVQSANVR